MKMMPRDPVLACLLCVCSFLASSMPGSAQDKTAAAADLKQLRAGYEAQLDKVNKAWESSVTNYQAQYIRSLTVLEKSLQEKGKLDPLLAAKKERERFAADPKVEEANLSVDVPELSALQMGYMKGLTSFPLKKARDVVTIAEQYKKSLTSVQEKTTKSGNLDAAIEVKAEREAVENRPEVSAARFAIAEADANKPPEEEKPAGMEKPASTTATTQPAKKPVLAAKKKYTGKPDNYIRKRFNGFCKAVLAQDMEAAMEFVDPRQVKERGTDEVKRRLGWAFPFLRMVSEQPGMKFDAGDVKVDDQEETATLIPRLWVKNGWRDAQASNWVQVDGDWYAVVEEGGPEGGGKKFRLRKNERD
jgi:hypothetical protein